MARRIDVIRIASGSSRGTGFLIDERHVVTALHVLGTVRQGKLVPHATELVLRGAVTEREQIRPVVAISSSDDVTFDAELDWACIDVGSSLAPCRPLSIGDISSDDIGGQWSTYGFPESSPSDGKATGGTIASTDAALTLGGRRIGAVQLYSLEAGAARGGRMAGYSGAPLVVRGRVVGLIVAAALGADARSEEGTVYALPLSALHTLLPTRPLPCPYPGLRPFVERDAPHFFGRSGEIRELLARLRAGERQILVVGPSGSGKSSLVAAGVIPNIGEPGVALVRRIRPGARPMEAISSLLPGSGRVSERLDEELARCAASRLLVVIDQLEELFTLSDSRSPAVQEFVEQYGQLVADRRCQAVLTLRADFYGELLDSSLWPFLADRSFQLALGPLRGRALADAIDGPAHAAGVKVEPTLRERLMADAGLEPGALPLLQLTLRSLWEAHASNQVGGLHLVDYVAMGSSERSGLAVAIERVADAVVHGMSDQDRETASRLLTRLVVFREGLLPTRRQQPLEMLLDVSGDPARDRHVLDLLTEAKLLVRDTQRTPDGLREVVDLAHEAIITGWPTFSRWIAIHRLAEQQRRTLEARVTDWVAGGRRDVGLLDATEIEQWRSRADLRPMLSRPEVGDYVAASEAAQRKTSRFRRRALSSLLEQARSASLAGQPALALSLLLEARKSGLKSPVAELLFAESRQEALQSAPTLTFEPADPARRIRFGLDDTHLLAFGNESTTVWNVERSQELAARIDGGLRGDRGSFAADGMRVAIPRRDGTLTLLPVPGKPVASTYPIARLDRSACTCMADRLCVLTSNTGKMWLADASTGAMLSPTLEAGHPMAVSPAGDRIAAFRDGVANVWCSRSARTYTLPVGDHVSFASFSGDGRRLLIGYRKSVAISVWSISLERRVGEPILHAERMNAAISFDGNLVVTWGRDKCVRVWNANNGKPITILAHDALVLSASISPRNDRIVTASTDGRARVFDAATGTPIGRPLAHEGTLFDASFDSNGGRIATACGDGFVRIWDATNLTRRYVSYSLTQPPTPHPIATVSFSPDGTQALTAGPDEGARLWDLSPTNAQLPILEHYDRVLDARFSNDGRSVATGSEDRTARVWSTHTGVPSSPPLEHSAAVRQVRFSGDDRYVVTATERSLHVWASPEWRSVATIDLKRVVSIFACTPNTVLIGDEKGVEARRLPSLEVSIPWVATLASTAESSASSDGRRFIVIDGDGITVRDTEGGLVVASFKVPHQIERASLSADGERALLVDTSGRIHVHDLRNVESRAPPLPHGEPVTGITTSIDGKRLLSTGGRTARLWDITSGRSRPMYHENDIVDGVLSPRDGRQVLLRSTHRTAFLWSMGAKGILTRITLTHRARRTPLRLAFSADGSHVLLSGASKTALLWSVTDNRLLPKSFRHNGLITDSNFSADGRLVATASRDRTACVWDLETDERVGSPLNHDARVSTVIFSRSNERVLTTSFDGSARLWEIATGKEIVRMDHPGRVRGAAFTPDESRIVTACADGGVRVWSADSGNLVSTASFHAGGVYGVVMSPDGSRVLSVGEDHCARVWNMTTLCEEPFAIPSNGSVLTASLSPSGTTIATTSFGRTARLWDIATSKPISGPLHHDKGPVLDAAFSSDGTRLVTAGGDHLLRIWDASTGREIVPPLSHGGTPQCVRFSPDGSRIATCTQRKMYVWFLPLDTGSLEEWSAFVDAVYGYHAYEGSDDESE